MSAHCPSCGSPVDVQPRTVSVEAGTCPSCSNAFVVLPPIADATTVSVVTPGGPVATPDAGEESPTGDADDDELTAVCAECGGALVLSVDDENVLAATCDDCDTVFKLVRADGAIAAEGPQAPSGPGKAGDDDGDDDDSESSGPRRRASGPRDDAPSFGRRERPSFDRRGGDWNAPPQNRARPCRKCGGAIVFSEGADGGMVGTCQSCGNRFSLRPRDDRGDSRGGGFRPGPRGRGPPPWKRGGGGGYGGGGFRGGGDRPRSGGFDRRRDDRSDDERPRRRRRDD